VASILADATHLTGLRRLSLRDMPLAAEGARVLGSAAHLADLVELGLSGSCNEAAAARALVTTPHLGRLRRLVVGGFPGLFGPPYEALEARFGKGVVTRS
jgi:hypothetical protein